ncbi:TadE/TadG family type IV pilus assembly protein [Coralliovum pocilloporae]|uniref:TadE/TadG family type IV pilus assembly protein n=1 Tax=Coralliovum pocilloporae TaxID=3066369 RepID=UPI00330755D6
MKKNNMLQRFFRKQLIREHQAARRIKRRFRDNSIAGVAAVEFAIILPLMLSMYLGSVEIGTALSAQRRVYHLASAVGDLVGREQTVNRAGLDRVFNLSASLMQPFSSAETTLTIASFVVDGNGRVRRDWIHSRNGTLRIDTDNVPAFLLQPNSSFIASGTRYIFRPSLAETIFPEYRIERFFFSRPRTENPVTCSNC